MKICYFSSEYVSHKRAAQDYISLLKTFTTLVSDPTEADIAILHCSPAAFPELYFRFPSLARTFVIGYCVWEAFPPPKTYIEGMRLVQEVWTCSDYCLSLFSPYHRNLHLVPHVVERDLAFNQIERQRITQIVEYDPSLCYFLYVASICDTRKNVRGLLAAFGEAQRRLGNLRLILKIRPDEEPPVPLEPWAICIRQHLPDTEMNALYTLSHAYISPHHSEAWGLTLSDAALFGRPMVASDYSGNRMFMNPLNSFLIECDIRQIEPQDRFQLFDGSMMWAYPDHHSLINTIIGVAESLDSPAVAEKCRAAKESVTAYSRTRVMGKLENRLHR